MDSTTTASEAHDLPVMWEADALTSRCLFVSRGAVQLFGFPLDEWRREPDFIRRRVLAEQGAQEGWRAVANTEARRTIAHAAFTIDGRLLHLTTELYAVRIDGGRV